MKNRAEPELPSSDDFARAIVAACRATGEDPATYLDGENPDSRARHYAIHALNHCFPTATQRYLGLGVNAPGKPGFFYRNSCRYAAGLYGRKSAESWDTEILSRVIDAVLPPAPPKPRPQPEVAFKPEVRKAGPPATAPRAPTSTPATRVRNTNDIVPSGRPGASTTAPGKRDLYAMLRAAAANTKTGQDNQ